MMWDSLSPLQGCDITDDRMKSPKPRQAHSQAPPLSPGIPQGPCPAEGSLGGQVLCPQAFCPLEALAHRGWRSLLAPAPGPVGCREAHPTPPRPAPAPEHPWILAHRGVQPQGARGHGVPSQLCPCQPGQAPSPPRGLHLLICVKGAAMRCSPPRIHPGEEAYCVPAHRGARGTAAPTADPPCDFQATDGHSGACGLSSDSWPTHQGSGLGLSGHSCGQAPGQEAPSHQQELPCRPK